MLTIGHLQATYSLLHGTPNVIAKGASLDRVARTRLPDAIGAHLQSNPEDERAVYRIKEMNLELSVDPSHLGERVIAEHWAHLIVTEMYRILSLGTPNEVVRYQSQAHYVAAFLEDLFAGRAWSRWIYDEFVPLKDVRPGRIAVQLLGARPSLILPVASLLQQRQQLEALLQHLDDDDIDIIWRHGLGLHGSGPIQILNGRQLDALAHHASELIWQHGGPVSRSRNGLRLYLSVAMREPRLTSDPAFRAACQRLSDLHALLPSLVAADLWPIPESPSPELVQRIVEMLVDFEHRSIASANWPEEELSTTAGHRYVAQLAQALRGVDRADATSGTVSRVAIERLGSEFTGLTLLFPAIRELGLLELVGSVGIYQLLLSLVGEVYEPIARHDASIAALAGIPKPDMESARESDINWPDHLYLRRAEINGDHDDASARQPRDSVGLQVLRQFALSIRGFERSSPEYLATQFIRLPGTIEISGDRIEVHVSRAPLGVVLRMSGYDGDQGPVPWLAGRRLIIHLPDG